MKNNMFICKAETIAPFVSEYERFAVEYKEQIDSIDGIDSKYVHNRNLDDVRRTIAICLGMGEECIKIDTREYIRTFPGYEGFLGRIVQLFKYGTLFSEKLVSIAKISVLTPSDRTVWSSVTVEEDSLYDWHRLKHTIKNLAKPIINSISA